jgi:hypothetical protein
MKTLTAMLTGALVAVLAVTAANASGEELETREGWAACQDGVAMFKALAKQAGPPGSASRRPLVLAACACARLALPYVRKGETRPLAAIEMAERWANGKEGVTLEQVNVAADAAHAAAAAARAAYAAEAAASASSADAASASSSAAVRVSSAVAATAFAASADAASAAAVRAADAASAADAAATAAAATAAANAAAAFAAYAASATVGYAGDAAIAAANAAAAADAATFAAARKRVVRKCADIVRRHYPELPALTRTETGAGS